MTETKTTDTPEAHHNRLMAEIDHELDHYGPNSLAEMIASIIDARIGDEDDPTSNYHTADGAYWRQCRKEFEDLAQALPSAETIRRALEAQQERRKL